jgi:two-component system sensor histidine kinase ChvG
MSRGETVVVDLGKMLETLADIHKSMAAQRATKIRLTLHENLTVIGHESRLGQVFRNLMENAVTFSPMGATITVTAVRETSGAANKTGAGDRIEVTVEDEGRGLPPGKEKTIFGRFYSERPETEKFGTHSGLGLSIAKQIVEAHGGTIRAENRKTPDGEIAGARFIVRLPAARKPIE